MVFLCTLNVPPGQESEWKTTTFETILSNGSHITHRQNLPPRKKKHGFIPVIVSNCVLPLVVLGENMLFFAQ
jgi:hypothetical protein